MTPPSMIRAAIGPWATRATSTATEPEIVAPTSGTKPPRKTSTPIASTNGTLRIAATIMIPTASTNATSTVARTNWVRLSHATRPDPSALARAARGNSRTTHAQMRRPSARKKYVAKSTMKKPATTWPIVAPTLVARSTSCSFPVVTMFCASSMASSSCWSVTFSGPSWSHRRISSRPVTTWPARSVAPLATCWVAKVSMRISTASTAMTTTMAATERRTTRVRTSTSGATSAARNIAMTTGSTTDVKAPIARATRYPAMTMTMNRHDQAAARSTPYGTCARVKLDWPGWMLTLRGSGSS
ncbi:MAG: hypothetical protein AVDCRST_MAG34-2492 [uncultured Nocardioidaceae bacterium]|uniref:Uncharacterized protein n=1 Tax=uncultured Nocardioidaceae bacterium TaxID=253824 RepID=A0A6J4MM96_9ACTN|nr:MAG: hypothetical protein AVDCRST_MAG34-2492 [uncultured Nocardioidaceae bacterium]